MLNSTLHISENIFDKDVEKKPTRHGFGEGLVEAGRADERVVALCADLTESTRIIDFKKEFPDRFIEVGVAEQALATIASGMANYGKIPFISSYAAFSPGRNWEQIRTTASLNDVPVKIIGSHTGLSVGPDGATHQALEDLALMRAIPNMVVIYPCDFFEAKKATIEVAKNLPAQAGGKPSYIRLAREGTPIMTTEKTPFEIGKAYEFWQSKNPQVVIIATGPLLYEALVAAKELKENGIEVLVINNPTIKPLDEHTLIRAARTCGAVVSVEEHQVNGGLGGALSELFAKNFPVPMEFIGVQDSFGESGNPDELLEKFKLKSSNIIDAVKKVIARKES
ncbi:MAG: Transketolase, central region [Candidatus Woesebacteria bacterium GW2011_GWA1_37_8]|uniref:Transketolase, central region n=1 Tax=Candidatus Woesebacteria bacterium GW2011_GWA1_37_8 TaxID=1618546 RepID=A0A0G0K4F9_9BACT|nr:MAG: Transketolase, central region [Microgenomates group bacterium GW2011_GWC1_37_12b]KKQ43989.1 MAG: Transketolase, central region [Candidatus Woesebacteria bacterium GW2011_GWA1_37_8]